MGCYPVAFQGQRWAWHSRRADTTSGSERTKSPWWEITEFSPWPQWSKEIHLITFLQSYMTPYFLPTYMATHMRKEGCTWPFSPLAFAQMHLASSGLWYLAKSVWTSMNCDLFEITSVLALWIYPACEQTYILGLSVLLLWKASGYSFSFGRTNTCCLLYPRHRDNSFKSTESY